MQEINEANFQEFFFDARITKPKQGQVLAKYTAVAEFVAGDHKQDIFNLLKTGRVQEAIQVMAQIHGAKIPWCYHFLREICEDLLKMPEREVENKPHELLVEYLFWTEPQYIPQDKHWERLHVIDYNSETKDYHSKIELS